MAVMGLLIAVDFFFFFVGAGEWGGVLASSSSLLIMSRADRSTYQHFSAGSHHLLSLSPTGDITAETCCLFFLSLSLPCITIPFCVTPPHVSHHLWSRAAGLRPPLINRGLEEMQM